MAGSQAYVKYGRSLVQTGKSQARSYGRGRMTTPAPETNWDRTALDIVNQIWKMPTDWPQTRRKAHAQVLITEALKAASSKVYDLPFHEETMAGLNALTIRKAD
jgi:hypothetical protein